MRHAPNQLTALPAGLFPSVPHVCYESSSRTFRLSHVDASWSRILALFMGRIVRVDRPLRRPCSARRKHDVAGSTDWITTLSYSTESSYAPIPVRCSPAPSVHKR